MSTNLRFVSWAAVSSLPQTKKVSLDDQLQTNREHVERHKGHLVAELVVPGESRSIVLFEDACRRIEAYARLKELIDAKAFDVLIYLDRSRLGRKASLSMAVVELCHEAGIATYETENPPTTIQANGTTSHDEMLIGAIKSVSAQREVQKLQERRHMGMIGRIKQGNFAYRVPWGWQASYDKQGNRHIEIDAEAAKIIRFVLLDCYLDRNMPIGAIVQELNRIGYRTQRGKPWTVSAIRNLLTRANRYAGWAEYRIPSKNQMVQAEGQWPAIISKDEAESIQRERQSRKLGPFNWHRLFSRTGYCDKCGASLVVAGTHHFRSPDKEYISYRCGNRCYGSWIPAQRIYEALSETITYLSDAANREALLRNIPDRTAGIRAQIEAVHGRLHKLQQQRERANRAYIELERLSIEEYDAQMATLQKRQDHEQVELQRLQRELKAAEHERNIEARLEEIAAAGHEKLNGPSEEANVWIRLHFRIYVADNRVVRIDY
jgi:DNA invertase Pin-like site-specific DNA recombinase